MLNTQITCTYLKRRIRRIRTLRLFALIFDGLIRSDRSDSTARFAVSGFARYYVVDVSGRGTAQFGRRREYKREGKREVWRFSEKQAEREGAQKGGAEARVERPRTEDDARGKNESLGFIGRPERDIPTRPTLSLSLFLSSLCPPRDEIIT